MPDTNTHEDYYLTAEQREVNDNYFKNIMETTKMWVWKDKGFWYKCDNGVMKPQDLKGFVDLVRIVSKDFAKKYLELPDELPINFKKNCNFSKSFNKNDLKHTLKYHFLKHCWEKEKEFERHHNYSALKQVIPPKKVRKGKKGRGRK